MLFKIYVNLLYFYKIKYIIRLKIRLKYFSAEFSALGRGMPKPTHE